MRIIVPPAQGLFTLGFPFFEKYLLSSYPSSVTLRIREVINKGT
jgi:hypothetical protein